MTFELNSLIEYTREIIVGLTCFFIISIFHVISIAQISFVSEVKIISDLKNKKYSRVIWTNLVLFLVLGFAHLIGVSLWAFFLVVTNLIPSLIEALLFSGSCYTTLGYMGDELPYGWRLLALFIAISGLFSFSISTAILLSKTGKFKEAWKMRHHARIMKYLKKHKLDEDDFHSL